MNPNQHEELKKILTILINADSSVSGNENLFGDIFSHVGTGLMNTASWIGGKAAEGMNKAFRAANSSLVQAFGSHKTKLNSILTLMKDEENKDVENIKLSKEILKKITVNGKISDIEPSLESLIKFGKALNEYRLELEAYSSKELELLKDFTNIKTIEDATSRLVKLDGLKFPSPKFGNNQNSVSKTDILPGGKIFIFNGEGNKFTIEGESVDSHDDEAEFSVKDIEHFVKRLMTIQELYVDIHKANVGYLDYVKKFNTVVADSFKHVESLKGKISTSVMRDLESRLEGNKDLFTFYSGFLPKVTIYIDDYVNTVSDYFVKQFN